MLNWKFSSHLKLLLCQWRRHHLVPGIELGTGIQFTAKSDQLSAITFPEDFMPFTRHRKTSNQANARVATSSHRKPPSSLIPEERCNTLYLRKKTETKGVIVTEWVLWLYAWINNHIHYTVWDEITYPFPNFNGCTVEVWEWMSSFIPHFIGYESWVG